MYIFIYLDSCIEEETVKGNIKTSSRETANSVDDTNIPEKLVRGFNWIRFSV
jgi:hypothetical protein